MTIEIYTDGACSGNPGPGGWAYVVVESNQIKTEQFGGESHTTNNRMELTAIIEALKISNNQNITLYSDSNLCVQTYNEWMQGWAARGWKKKGGEIKNLDLVQQLYQLKKQNPNVKIQWIKAHAGHEWNEYVDELAQKGIDELAL